MSQQIINIPIYWDDSRITELIEKGVANEIGNVFKERFGLRNRYDRMNWELAEIVKEETRKILKENKDYILDEVIKKCHKSITSTKDYKETKAKL